MARFYDVHPDNPQPRAIRSIAELMRDGGVVAVPTTSGFALAVTMANAKGRERIRQIRGVGERHHFTVLVSQFAQFGQYVTMSNAHYRALKASNAGEFTFILPATRELPKAMLHPKKRTVGVRISNHLATNALLDELGEPLVCSTLILPDETDPLDNGWDVKEQLDHVIDAVLDSGDAGSHPTTVVNLSGPEPVVERVGIGDPSAFMADA